MNRDHETPFQKALSYSLREKGYGAQSALARKIGKRQQYISLLVKGAADGSESTRRQIAEAYGYSYEEFLALGRDLLEGKAPTEKTDERNHAPKLNAVTSHEKDVAREGIIAEFQNTELALELIRYLLGIEKYSPERLQAVRDMLKGMYEGIKPVESKKHGNHA